MGTKGPTTRFIVKDPTGVAQDLSDRYVSKDYLIDVYPNLVFPSGTKKSPGLWTCGYNDFGQLGNGTRTYYSSPIQIGALTNWRQVSVGGLHIWSVKTDGTLWACGYNGFGALGNGTRVNYSSPIQIGALTNWRQVSTSLGSFSHAIKTDGTLWTCGYNLNGALGNGTRVNYSSPIQIGTLTNWKQVSCGETHTTAIKTDGTLWTWGQNPYGGLGNGTTINYSSPIQIGALTNWKQVSAAQYFTTSIKNDGTLWTFGYNIIGQLGNGTTTDYSSPIQIGTSTDWKQISTRVDHVLALKTSGTIWGWGRNNQGELGNGGLGITYNSPIQIGTLTNWKMIEAGHESSFGIKQDGTLWAWGWNNIGELGTNNTTQYNSPIQIGTYSTWKQISSNRRMSAFIQDGYI